ncbi:MAG: YidC/Oxa1 family membrane protein insertase [Lactobacillales bacterium]|jgi:YidC/Oxa1 family membrane protein insertase|nr:YidC/Oxa1 family membrane protein insertase [Lactobacillales bacterium]
MKKKLLLAFAALSSLVLLTGCGTSAITAKSTGLWEHGFVWNFGQVIKFLSFGGSMGVGIILFTLVIRVILFPLMHFQMKSMRKMQDLKPELDKLKVKYPGKDQESKQKAMEEQQRIYKENGVNPYVGCLPMLVQMPVLWALYQSISRIQEIHNGHFWIWDLGLHFSNSGNNVIYLILPVLAALATFASSYLNQMSQVEKNSTTTMMTYGMPIMILFMGLGLASGVALYWTISNLFQAGQTMIVNNPFTIKAERQAKIDAEKAKQKALKKLQKKR